VNDCPPYTTSTGLRIGSMYDRPQRSYITPEGEQVQRAYLSRGLRLLPFRLAAAACYLGAAAALLAILILAIHKGA
jgi:hypothetical protein